MRRVIGSIFFLGSCAAGLVAAWQFPRLSYAGVAALFASEDALQGRHALLLAQSSEFVGGRSPALPIIEDLLAAMSGVEAAIGIALTGMLVVLALVCSLGAWRSFGAPRLGLLWEYAGRELPWRLVTGLLGAVTGVCIAASMNWKAPPSAALAWSAGDPHSLGLTPANTLLLVAPLVIGFRTAFGARFPRDRGTTARCWLALTFVGLVLGLSLPHVAVYWSWVLPILLIVAGIPFVVVFFFGILGGRTRAISLADVVASGVYSVGFSAMRDADRRVRGLRVTPSAFVASLAAALGFCAALSGIEGGMTLAGTAFCALAAFFAGVFFGNSGWLLGAGYALAARQVAWDQDVGALLATCGILVIPVAAAGESAVGQTLTILRQRGNRFKAEENAET